MRIIRKFPTIKDNKYHLIQHPAGLVIGMDFSEKKPEGDNIVVDCSITTERSCRLYEAVIGPDKSIALRKPKRRDKFLDLARIRQKRRIFMLKAKKKAFLAPSILNVPDNERTTKAAQAVRIGREEDMPVIAHFDVIDANKGKGTKIVQPKAKDTRQGLKPDKVKEIIDKTRGEAIVDVHLMVMDPSIEEIIDPYIENGAGIITLHWEGFEDKKVLLERLKYIRSHGVMAGLAINPDIDIKVAGEFIKQNSRDIDMVLQMSVFPGKGGQKFMASVLENIRAFRSKYSYTGLIQIDGGINQETIKDARDAGVDIFVAGSAFFRKEDMSKNGMRESTRILREALDPEMATDISKIKEIKQNLEELFSIFNGKRTYDNSETLAGDSINIIEEIKRKLTTASDKLWYSETFKNLKRHHRTLILATIKSTSVRTVMIQLPILAGIFSMDPREVASALDTKRPGIIRFLFNQFTYEIKANKYKALPISALVTVTLFTGIFLTLSIFIPFRASIILLAIFALALYPSLKTFWGIYRKAYTDWNYFREQMLSELQSEVPEPLNVTEDDSRPINHFFAGLGLPSNDELMWERSPWKRDLRFTIAQIPIARADNNSILAAFNLNEDYALSGNISIIYYDETPLVLGLEETSGKVSLIDLADYYTTGDQELLDDLVTDIFHGFPKSTIEQIPNRYIYLVLTSTNGVFIEPTPPNQNTIHDLENSRVIRIPILPGAYAPFHPSSRVCARAAMRYAKPEMKVLVIGTGTGTEAVISALNGATVDAIDLKRISIENTKLSAIISGTESNISTKVNDLFKGLGEYDLILFNMPIVKKYKTEKEEVTPLTRNVEDVEGNLVERVASELPAHLADNGIAVLVNEEFASKIQAEDGKYYSLADYLRHVTGYTVETNFFQTEGNSLAYIVSKHGSGVIRRTRTIKVSEFETDRGMRFETPRMQFSVGYFLFHIDRYLDLLQDPGISHTSFFGMNAKAQGRFLYDMLNYIAHGDNIGLSTFAKLWINLLDLKRLEYFEKHPTSNVINDYIQTHNRFSELGNTLSHTEDYFSRKLKNLQEGEALSLNHLNNIISSLSPARTIKVLDEDNPKLDGYDFRTQGKYIYASREATLADLWAYIAHEIAHTQGAEEGFARSVDVDILRNTKTVAYTLRYVASIAPVGAAKKHMEYLANLIEHYALDYELDIHNARLQITREGERFLSDHLLGKIERAPPGYVERIASSLNGIIEVSADPKMVDELKAIGVRTTDSEPETQERRLTRWAQKRVLAEPTSKIKTVESKIAHIKTAKSRETLFSTIIDVIETGRNIPYGEIANFVGQRDVVQETIDLLTNYTNKTYDATKNKRAYRLLIELHQRFTHNDTLIKYYEYLTSDEEPAIPPSREIGQEAGHKKLLTTNLLKDDYYFMLGDIDRLNNRNRIFSKGLIGTLGKPQDTDVIFSKHSLFAEMLELLSRVGKAEGFDVYRYLSGDEFVPQYFTGDVTSIRTKLNVVRNAFRKSLENKYGVARVTALTDKEKSTLEKNPEVLAIVRHGHGYNILIRRDGSPFKIQLKTINEKLKHTLKAHKFNNGLFPALTLSIGGMSARAIIANLESLDGIKRTDDNGYLMEKYVDEVYTWGIRMANDMLQIAKTKRNAVFVKENIDPKTIKKPIKVPKEKPVREGIDRLTRFYNQGPFRKHAKNNLALIEVSSYNGKESRDEGGFHAVNNALSYDDANEVIATIAEEIREAVKNLGLKGVVFGRAPPDKFFMSTNGNVSQETLAQLLAMVHQKVQSRLSSQFSDRFAFNINLKLSSVSLRDIRQSRIPEFKNKFRIIDAISKLEKAVEMTGSARIEEAVLYQKIENVGEVRIYSSDREKEKALQKDYRILQELETNEAIAQTDSHKESPTIHASRASKKAQFLRDISDLDQLPQNVLEAIYSVLFDGKKLILAFDRNLSRFDEQHYYLMRQLTRWKKRVKRRYPKLAETMDNFIVLHYASQNELLHKLEDTHLIDINDSRNNLILAFSPKEEDATPMNIGQAVRPVYIDEGRGFALNYYYPLLEIVTISLAKALMGYTKDEIYSIFETLGIDRAKLKEELNIDEITDGGEGAFLIFTLIPRAKRYDPDTNLVDRYTRLLRFLQSA